MRKRSKIESISDVLMNRTNKSKNKKSALPIWGAQGKGRRARKAWRGTGARRGQEPAEGPSGLSLTPPKIRRQIKNAGNADAIPPCKGRTHSVY